MTAPPLQGLRSAARALSLSGVVQRAIEARVLDTSLALSSRLFVAVIPLTLVVSAVVPAEQTLAERIVSTFGLTGQGREAAQALLATPTSTRAGLTAFSFLVVLYSLVSCAGVLQRAYQAVWEVERGRWAREVRVRAAWAVALALYVGISIGLSDVTLPAPLELIGAVLRVVVAVGFFAWTPYLLLDRRISAGQLLPTALLTAAALAAMSVVAPLYMPNLASGSAASYGLIGFAFAFLTWLFCQSLLVLSAAVVGAELAWERGGRAS